MTRYRAAGLHLLTSALIASLILLAMLSVWYPGAYFNLMGGATLLFVLVGVDVCLGPLMTLVIFKSGKKGLKFDLVVIAVLQFSAMMYGVYVMSQARPVFTVFAGDKFLVAAANDIDDAELAKAAVPEWKSRPLLGPQLTVALPPQDAKERENLVFAAMAGLDMHQFPKLYAPYEANRKVVQEAAKPLRQLRKEVPASAAQVDSFLLRHKADEASFVYVPIRGRAGFMTVVLSAETAEVVEILEIDPYPA